MKTPFLVLLGSALLAISGCEKSKADSQPKQEPAAPAAENAITAPVAAPTSTSVKPGSGGGGKTTSPSGGANQTSPTQKTAQ